MPNAKAQLPIYGRTPLMVSAQCVYKTMQGCKKGKEKTAPLSLSDRRGMVFPLQERCSDCYNVIYNSLPLFLLHQEKTISGLGFGSYRISLVDESPQQTVGILKAYEKAFVKKEKIQPPAGKNAFTTGHFGRGVE